MQLENKVVLITGGTDGIGASCVRCFRGRGAHVAMCGLHPGTPIADKEILSLHGDLTVAGIRKDVIERTIGRFGRLDILVNCAGVGLYAPANETDLTLAKQMFELNVFAPLDLVRLAAPYMLAQGGGTIVNIGSVGAWAALPWATMYCASKCALHSLSEGLYRELRHANIHVLTVVPGIVKTHFRDHVLAGVVPAGVKQISTVISPDDLAQRIVRGVEGGKRKVVMPWTARVFGAVNALFPSVVDFYCDFVDRGTSKLQQPTPDKQVVA